MENREEESFNLYSAMILNVESDLFRMSNVERSL